MDYLSLSGCKVKIFAPDFWSDTQNIPQDVTCLYITRDSTAPRKRDNPGNTHTNTNLLPQYFILPSYYIYLIQHYMVQSITLFVDGKSLAMDRRLKVRKK